VEQVARHRPHLYPAHRSRIRVVVAAVHKMARLAQVALMLETGQARP